MIVLKTSNYIQSRSIFQTQVMNLQPHPKPQIMTWTFFAPLKSRYKVKIWNIGVSKTSYYIQSKIKMQNTSQEPPAPTKIRNQDLKDIDVLCTLKIIKESKNSDPE